MTVNQVKQLVVAELANREIGFSKISAKSVSFADLARASAVFIEVRGVYQVIPDYEQLKAKVRAEGFILSIV